MPYTKRTIERLRRGNNSPLETGLLDAWLEQDAKITRLLAARDYRWPDDIGWDGVSDCVALLGKQAEEIKRVKSENDRLAPFETAIKDAHNGYNPEVRAAMPRLKEPATPKDAIDELIQETEALAALEAASYTGEIEQLRKWCEHLEGDYIRLEAVVAKLPKCNRLNDDKTALVQDCPVSLGMTVFFIAHGQISHASVGKIVQDAEGVWLGWSFRQGRAPEDCYNSLEAAEFAKNPGN